MTKFAENIIEFAFIILTCLLMVHACGEGIDRQIEADYKQCLAWQADGYPVQCKNPIPKD